MSPDDTPIRESANGPNKDPVDRSCAADSIYEELVLSVDDGLLKGTWVNLTDSTRLPPPLAASFYQTADCLRLLHEAATAGQLDDLLTREVISGGVPLPLEVPNLKQIGRFEIVRELGRGGYGVVFLALDPRLSRAVALKVPRPEVLITAELQRRFVREAEAAAALQHPNLVAVYEAGEDGPLCYLATEFCPGPTLAEWLDQNARVEDPREAALLIAALADGVAHAHSRGVLHRDIKPSNVLLEPIAEIPEDQNLAANPLSSYMPKLTDFGLAKLLERDDDQTRSGIVLGTPAYMAPEQATGNLREVCAATDVHGLGVLLYELLLGRAPFRGKNDTDTLRRLCLDEPVHPNRVRSHLPSDLAAIALKCLEKQPSARYGSAADLASDLRRYLTGEVTQARPLRVFQRTLRWAHRRPLIAGLSGIIVAGAVVLIGVVALYTSRLSTALVESEQRRIEADEQRHEADRQRELAVASRRRASVSQEEAHRLLYAADIHLADEAYRANNPSEAVARLRRHLPTYGDGDSKDLREFAWRYLWHRCQDRLLTLSGHAGPVFGVEYSPDGKHVVTAGQDGTVRFWDATTGQPIRSLQAHRGDVNGISISPDGQTVASVGADGAVRIVNFESGQVVRSIFENDSELFAVDFSPSGKLLAAGGKSQCVKIWRTDSWELVGTLQSHADFIESIDFAPDEKTLASAGSDSQVILWNLDRQEPGTKLEGRCGAVYCVKFSPTGNSVAAGGQNGELVFWDVATGAERRRSQPHATRVTSLAFSPDGSQLLTASRDASARLWDVASGGLTAVFEGHAERLWQVAFAPDGDRIATTSSDGTAKLCKLSAPFEILPEYTVDRGQIAVNAAGKVYAVSRSGSESGGVRVYEGHRQDDWLREGVPTTILQTTMDPTGSAFAALTVAGEVFLRTKATEWRLILTQIPYGPLILSPGGRHLACGDQRLKILDLSVNDLLLDTMLPAAPSCTAFSSDGRRLAVALVDGSAALWNRDDGPVLKILPVDKANRPVGICFSPDDQRLAVATESGRILILNAHDGSIHLDFAAQAGIPTSLCFSPDGRNLATTAQDHAVRVWDIWTGQMLLLLDQLPHKALSLTFDLHSEELLGCLSEAEVVRWTAPRKPQGFSRAKPHDVHFGNAITVPAPTKALPWGEPLRMAPLQKILERFATLSARQRRIIQPTFDDRESGLGFQLGAIALPESKDFDVNHSAIGNGNEFAILARGADDYARRLGKAGFPHLQGGRLTSIVMLEPEAFVRAEVPAGELGDIDSDRDRFREIHRWAKSHGYAGGIPTFTDGEKDGQSLYGAVLIKPDHGDEIFFPTTVIWRD